MTRIVLLSDGTGNSAAKVWRTNVWRTFESLDLSGSEQVAFYDDGVGTSSFKPFAILGGALGWGLKRNVLDLYRSVCRNYRLAGDEIFAFGFSRGAFTIRVLNGLILNQGLVPYGTEAELTRKAKEAYRAYRKECFHSVLGFEKPLRWLRDLFNDYDKTRNRQVSNIRFLGLWDTVAAYGMPIEEMTRGISQWIWPLELPDRTLNPKILRACHALSLDDERTTFHPVLWNEQGELPAAPDDTGSRHIKNERITQVWFAGAHANVGGGYPDDSLALVPLFWIMNEAKECGLIFKMAPDADPDVLKHTKSARDKDGRLYDPRQGLGGYYRYGPRRIFDLCHMRLSRKPADQVQIDVPKIHESALKRIQTGAHVYAPIGLPETYEVVTDDGRILPRQANPYETPNQARARAQLQERVWNLVWKRRIVYFITVAVSLYLVLYPLFRVIPSWEEYETLLRPLSDFIRLIGSFLPGTFDVWISAYARNPAQFLVVALLVAFFIGWGSRLAGRITDEMRAIWKDKREDPTTRLPDDWVYRLRTHTLYRHIHWVLKRHIAPFFLALATVWLVLTMASHLLFNFEDAAGLICRDSPSPHGLAVGESRTMEFDTSALCPGSGVLVERGGHYRLMVSVVTPWRDGTIMTGPKGFYIGDLGWTQRVLFSLAWPLKRAFIRPWFRVIARVGATGTDEDFLDPDPKGPVDQTLREDIRPRRDGELFFYVNDAVIAVPWLQDIFYRNNSGRGRVIIERR